MPPEPSGRRAALYLRVSTADQGREGYSLPNQLAALRAHCERERWYNGGAIKEGPGGATNAPGHGTEGVTSMQDQHTALKRCTRCQRDLPASREFFFVWSRGRDGLQSWCKACRASYRDEHRERFRAYAAKHRAAHRDELNAQQKAYYVAHPERQRERHRRHYAKYRERICERTRAWKRANAEGERLRLRRWAQENRLRVNEKCRRRRVLMKATAFEKIDYARVLARDGYVCHLCGGLVAPVELSFDHMAPLSIGGTHTYDNIAVAHLWCNKSKTYRVQPSVLPPPIGPTQREAGSARRHLRARIDPGAEQGRLFD